MKLKDIKTLNENLDQTEIKAFADHVKQQLGLEEFDLELTRTGDIRLDLIIVPRNLRKQGVGSKALNLLTRYADSKGVRVVLTTAQRDPRTGTTSKSRLMRFYRRFGFVRNQGRNKDFTLSLYDNMYRRPKTN